MEGDLERRLMALFLKICYNVSVYGTGIHLP